MVDGDAPFGVMKIDVDVERRGAACPSLVGRRDKRDDVAEDAIWEATDLVGEALFLLQSPLLGPGDHPHGQGAALEMDGGAVAGGVEIGSSMLDGALGCHVDRAARHRLFHKLPYMHA
jgi:hypothetical protein